MTVSSPPAPRLVRTALLGVIAAFVPAAVLLGPVIAGWMIDSRSTTSWNDAVGVGLQIWALAHRGIATVDETTIVFVPILVTIFALVTSRAASRAAMPSGVPAPKTLGTVIGTFTISYAFAASCLAVISDIGHGGINWVSMLPGAILIPLLGFLWALYSLRAHDEIAETIADKAREKLPYLLLRGMPAVFRGVSLLLLSALLLLIVLILFSIPRVLTVSAEMAPDTGSMIMLFLLQIAVLPNVLALTVGWMAGGTISLGAVHIGHGSVTAGTLPALPILGIIPDPPGAGLWAWLSVLIVIGVGGEIGYRANSNVTALTPIITKIMIAASASAIAFLLLSGFIWLASGGISGGVLSSFGANIWAYLLLGSEMLGGAIIAAIFDHYRRIDLQ